MKRIVAVAAAALLWAGCNERRDSAREAAATAAEPRDDAQQQAQQTDLQLQEQQRAQAEQQNAQTQPGVGGSGVEEPTAPSPEPLEARPFTGDTQNIVGKVEKSEAGQLAIRQNDGQLMTLTLHPETQVIVDGRAQSVDQIAEGSQVRASFDPSTGESGMGKIEIQSMGAQPQQPQPEQPAQQ